MDIRSLPRWLCADALGGRQLGQTLYYGYGYLAVEVGLVVDGYRVARECCHHQ